MTIPSKAKGDGMSEHSIEELRRQVAQARSRRDQADKNLREAMNRLNAKKMADSGLIGKVATDKGRSLVIRSIVYHGENDSVPRYYVGPRLLKSGALGQHIEIYAGFSGVKVSDAPHPQSSNSQKVTA